MADLLWYQYALIGLLFVWSGLVRSGLGFGGSVMALPFLLLILNEPLVFLPLIAVHLLVFAALTVWQNQRNSDPTQEQHSGSTVDWRYLGKALAIMIIPKLAGVLGLLTLPTELMSGIIFVIIGAYSFSYVLNKPFRSTNRWLDILFLCLGAYISGASLIGAPLIIAVFMTHVSRYQLRDTLFVLWFVLVSIKMVAFVLAGVDLQLIHHLWLLPCAAVGHLAGLRLHNYLQQADTSTFYRVLGSVLIGVSGIGLWQAFG